MLVYFMTDACENLIDGRETRKKQFMRALLWGKNSEGLTPLVLTANMSCPGMFQLLINTTIRRCVSTAKYCRGNF